MEWERKQTQQAIRDEKALARTMERERKARTIEDMQATALKLTAEAEKQQQAIDRIVLDRLDIRIPKVEDYLDYTPYSVFPPTEPVLLSIPREPLITDEEYIKRIPFSARFSKKKMEQFNATVASAFQSEHDYWIQKATKINVSNNELVSQYTRELNEWSAAKEEYEKAQSEGNSSIREFFQKFQEGDAESIARFFVLALDNIKLPFEHDLCAESEYDRNNKRLIVDLILPTIESIPKKKAVTYIKSKNAYKETNYPESYIRKKYDSVIYQIVLLCVYYVFKLGKQYSLADYVVINGRLNCIDKATGHPIQPCVLSLSTNRTAFQKIRIDSVDPKEWFRKEKGYSAASFATITPVAPIQSISREDSRFIDGYNVTNQLNEDNNLAAMDWKDFENLIRDVFEEEFCANGGEVRITQASHDGGVDAIAYDNDPIRGGKIVIQAKRYTNVVNVSAVRDLYGTVMNEGANKGILVTTSYYGNDSYDFAKGKPLLLLDGANLLHLLEKHGHKARIDLSEAKEKQRASKE